MAHALIARPDAAAGSSANERLRERYSTIEECRADLVGLVFLDFLASRAAVPRPSVAQSAPTFVASSLRVLRFGRDNDYGRAATIILSHLMRAGAIAPQADGRLDVHPDRTAAAAAELASRVQAIAATGTYEDAGTLIEELGALPPEIAGLLTRLDDLPIDLELRFDASLAG
jgi:hypothetical protein